MDGNGMLFSFIMGCSGIIGARSGDARNEEEEMEGDKAGIILGDATTVVLLVEVDEVFEELDNERRRVVLLLAMSI